MKKRNLNKKNVFVEEKLRRFSKLKEKSLYKEFSSSSEGISKSQVLDLEENFGKNIITSGRKNTKLTRLIKSIINPFNLILIAIAVVTYFLDVFFEDDPNYVTVIVITSLVALSSIISFIQGEKSNDATKQLTNLISTKVDVIRDGKESEILIEDLLPGDLIKVSAGDMIPGDVRFVKTKDLFIAQSALTGESNPVEKFSEVKSNKKVSLTDLDNIGFMGSNVISGVALAIVVLTGNDTYFGSMAQQISTSKNKNSFQKGVESISKLLIKMMIVMVPIVFLINSFGPQAKQFKQSFLFAISVAVGLTPELLPVILTSTLATGAIAMSKHKVIVKDLGAIQTFGQMDILCTDKTGTLTEDKIVLEKYLNVHGEDDLRVLRHAYLNSYFQTGLKNLIDIAVINRASLYDLDHIVPRYEVVDEIPFDFERRRMSVVLLDDKGKKQLITKGAVEEMLSISKFIEVDGEVREIDEETYKLAMNTYQKYNKQGLRMLAVAQKNEVPDSNTFSVKDEKEMVIIGFIGFLDPPKESAKIAIKTLKNKGVRTVVLTGDSEQVAIKVCQKVGIDVFDIMLGIEVEEASDEELLERIVNINLFAKLSPNQKERIVGLYQHLGHTVGYLGDGINDALALRKADVGISVDNAVDIAKETADIILLEKDLLVLEEGVNKGRITFGNVSKYIKMAVSGNFGNIFSLIFASLFLPFLPMLPLHILIQNLLNDFAQIGIPFDKVDFEYASKPRKWDSKSIRRFMIWFGPLSSIFDILLFFILFKVFNANRVETQLLFQTGWFIFGTLSQILIIYIIRSRKLPFIGSKVGKPLVLSSLVVMIITSLLVFTPIANKLSFTILPLSFIPWLLLVLLGYIFLTQLIKVIYIKKHDEWL